MLAFCCSENLKFSLLRSGETICPDPSEDWLPGKGRRSTPCFVKERMHRESAAARGYRETGFHGHVKADRGSIPEQKKQIARRVRAHQVQDMTRKQINQTSFLRAQPKKRPVMPWTKAGHSMALFNIVGRYMRTHQLPTETPAQLLALLPTVPPSFNRAAFRVMLAARSAVPETAAAAPTVNRTKLERQHKYEQRRIRQLKRALGRPPTKEEIDIALSRSNKDVKHPGPYKAKLKKPNPTCKHGCMYAGMDALVEGDWIKKHKYIKCPLCSCRLIECAGSGLHNGRHPIPFAQAPAASRAEEVDGKRPLSVNITVRNKGDSKPKVTFTRHDLREQDHPKLVGQVLQNDFKEGVSKCDLAELVLGDFAVHMIPPTIVEKPPTPSTSGSTPAPELPLGECTTTTTTTLVHRGHNAEQEAYDAELLRRASSVTIDMPEEKEHTTLVKQVEVALNKMANPPAPIAPADDKKDDAPTKPPEDHSAHNPDTDPWLPSDNVVPLRGIMLTKKEAQDVARTLGASYKSPITHEHKIQYYRGERRILPNRAVLECKQDFEVCRITYEVPSRIFTILLAIVAAIYFTLIIPVLLSFGIITALYDTLVSTALAAALYCWAPSYKHECCYVPHLVGAALQEYDRGTNEVVLNATLGQHLRRMAAFPMPDYQHNAYLEGTKQVVHYAMHERGFYFRPGRARVWGV